MLRPKAGDTVVCELEVAEVTNGGTSFYFVTNLGGKSDIPIVCKRITEIKIPPKVGDTVWWDKDANHMPSPSHGSTLLYIHGDTPDRGNRKWGVCAFKGDIPVAVDFNQLRTHH